MKVGDTFLYPLYPPDSEHLWIVLTNADADGQILIVNLTTAYSFDKDSVDATVCLNPGEHPFIKQESYVFYREAMIKKVADLQTEEKTGRLKMQADCSSTIISLVRGGIGASRHCKRSVRKFYDERRDL